MKKQNFIKHMKEWGGIVRYPKIGGRVPPPSLHRIDVLAVDTV